MSLDWQEIASLSNPNYVDPNSNDIAKRVDLEHKSLDENIDLSSFCGRERELETLQRWILHQKCRLILLTGFGGVGKTFLAAKLLEQLQSEFKYVIWRTLKHTCSLQGLLTDLIRAVSDLESHDFEPDGLCNPDGSCEGKITCLLKILRQHRCLIFLDDGESILESGSHTGIYCPGYESYFTFLERMKYENHQSCLIFITREKPVGMSTKESDKSKFKSLQIGGLDSCEGESFLKTIGLKLSSSDSSELVRMYDGNPQMLKVAGFAIHYLFSENLSVFLSRMPAVFGEIQTLLDRQFERLSLAEKNIIYWLSINSELTTILDIQKGVAPTITSQELIEVLLSLQWRSLIQKKSGRFVPLNIVTEYSIKYLIDNLCDDILHEKIDFLGSYSITDYSNTAFCDMQKKIIFQSLVQKLLIFLRERDLVKDQLSRLLDKLQNSSDHYPYAEEHAVNNILGLLQELQSDSIGDSNWTDPSYFEGYSKVRR